MGVASCDFKVWKCTTAYQCCDLAPPFCIHQTESNKKETKRHAIWRHGEHLKGFLPKVSSQVFSKPVCLFDPFAPNASPLQLRWTQCWRPDWCWELRQYRTARRTNRGPRPTSGRRPCAQAAWRSTYTCRLLLYICLEIQTFDDQQRPTNHDVSDSTTGLISTCLFSTWNPLLGELPLVGFLGLDDRQGAGDEQRGPGVRGTQRQARENVIPLLRLSSWPFLRVSFWSSMVDQMVDQSVLGKNWKHKYPVSDLLPVICCPRDLLGTLERYLSWGDVGGTDI